MRFKACLVLLGLCAMTVTSQAREETPQDRLYHLLSLQLRNSLQFKSAMSLARTLNRFTQFEQGNYKLIGRSIVCNQKHVDPKYVSRERWEAMVHSITDDIHETLTIIREIYEEPYDDDEAPYLYQMPTWRSAYKEAVNRYWGPSDEDEEYQYTLSNLASKLKSPSKMADSASRVWKNTVNKVSNSEALKEVNNISAWLLISLGSVAFLATNIGLTHVCSIAANVAIAFKGACNYINGNFAIEHRVNKAQIYVCLFSALVSHQLLDSVWILPVVVLTSFLLSRLMAVIRTSTIHVSENPEDIVVAIPGILAVFYIIYRMTNNPIEGWADKFKFWSVRDMGMKEQLTILLPVLMLPVAAYVKVLAAENADTTTKTMVEKWVIKLKELGVPQWCNAALQPESLLASVAIWRSLQINTINTGIVCSIPVTIISIVKGLIAWREPRSAQWKAMLSAWVPEYNNQVTQRHIAHKMIFFLVAASTCGNVIIGASSMGNPEMGYIISTVAVVGALQMKDLGAYDTYLMSAATNAIILSGYSTWMTVVSYSLVALCSLPLIWHKLGLDTRIDTRDHEITRNVVEDVINSSNNRQLREELGLEPRASIQAVEVEPSSEVSEEYDTPPDPPEEQAGEEDACV